MSNLDFVTQENAFLDGEQTELTAEQQQNAADIVAAQAAIDAANAQMKAALAKQTYLTNQAQLIVTFRADLAAASPTTPEAPQVTPQDATPVQG